MPAGRLLSQANVLSEGAGSGFFGLGRCLCANPDAARMPVRSSRSLVFPGTQRTPDFAQGYWCIPNSKTVLTAQVPTLLLLISVMIILYIYLPVTGVAASQSS